MVISAPYPSKMHYTAGENLSFSITLLGAACDFEHSIAGAAKLMCNGKLEAAKLISCKQSYNIKWTDAGASKLSPCNNLTINFLTPTEILENGKPPTQLDFATFVDRVFVRIAGVIDNHGEGEFTIPYRLMYNKPYVKTESNLQAVKLQTSGQPITGFVGKVQYTGNITRYLPYIDLCSQIHVGKKTSRSCGKYIFEI